MRLSLSCPMNRSPGGIELPRGLSDSLVRDGELNTYRKPAWNYTGLSC
jgi:hypothetical protein